MTHFKLTSDTALFIHKLQCRIDDEIIELEKSHMKHYSSLIVHEILTFEKVLTMITHLVAQLEAHEKIDRELRE